MAPSSWIRDEAGAAARLTEPGERVRPGAATLVPDGIGGCAGVAGHNLVVTSCSSQAALVADVVNADQVQPPQSASQALVALVVLPHAGPSSQASPF